MSDESIRVLERVARDGTDGDRWAYLDAVHREKGRRAFRLACVAIGRPEWAGHKAGDLVTLSFRLDEDRPDLFPPMEARLVQRCPCEPLSWYAVSWPRWPRIYPPSVDHHAGVKKITLLDPAEENATAESV